MASEKISVNKLVDALRAMAITKNLSATGDVCNAADALELLEREVKAWRAAEHLRIDESHTEFVTRADARAATDARLTLTPPRP